MNITTIQWNIGGAMIREEDSDPTESINYRKEDLSYIARVINEHHPDIVTLQETHKSESFDQAEELTQSTDLSYFVTDSYDRSPHADGCQLSQSILSRHPILSHDFTFFSNPEYEVVRPNGEKWKLHDKGLTSCLVGLGEGNVMIETLHMFAFDKFNIDPLSARAKEIRSDVQEKIESEYPLYILQGDFNVDGGSLASFLPDFFDDNTREVVLENPTTPWGSAVDHIIYRGLKATSCRIISDALTDHYPLITEFRI